MSLKLPSGTLSQSSRRARSGGAWTGTVHGGAGGSGVLISQATRPLFVASRGSIGGSYGSGVGVGSGSGYGSHIGVSSAAGYGASTAVGLGSGLGSGAAFNVGARFGDNFGGGDVGILGNEKFTLRNLNDRFASYLKKVRMLEKSNADYELKISQYVDSRTTPTVQDYSDTLNTISELRTKILDAIQDKGFIQITLDNTTLAADDFRIKYENELAMRQSVEADIYGLKRLLDDFNLSKKELTLQIDTLNDEKDILKNNHEEEMVTTRSQMSGQIHVEVEAKPQEDLSLVLEDIRDHYETIAAKNRRDLEGWFKRKLDTLKQEFVISEQIIDKSKTETTTEKTKVQGLEVELHSLLAVKTSLEAKLLEKQAFYSGHLSGYQLQVRSLEDQMMQLRADLERQGRDYQLLLDIKTRLEMEISEYRRLLDLGTIEIKDFGTSKATAAAAAAATTHTKQKGKEEVKEGKKEE